MMNLKEHKMAPFPNIPSRDESLFPDLDAHQACDGCWREMVGLWKEATTPAGSTNPDLQIELLMPSPLALSNL